MFSIRKASLSLIIGMNYLLLSGCTTVPIRGAPTGGPYDIEITGIEVTQGVQNMNNLMPLISDRQTVVRLYARELLGKNVQGVRAMISVDVSAKTTDGGATGYGINTFSDRISVSPSGSNRLDTKTTFDIPISLHMPVPSPGAELDGPVKISISAIVNDDRLSEEPGANNQAELTGLELYQADPIKLHFVPVHLHEPSPDEETPVDPTSPVFEHQFFDGQADWFIASTALRHHPASSGTGRYVISWQTAPVFPIEHNSGAEWNLWVGDDRTAITAQIKTLNDLDDDSFKTYAGMVSPEASASEYKGWAKNDVFWLVMYGGIGDGAPWDMRGGWLLAHEAGHQRNISHVLCNGTESNADPNYPWPSNGQPCRLATIDDQGYYGYDVYWDFLGQPSPAVISNDPTASSPNLGFPLMGYKAPQWVSPYEFCKLMPSYNVPCALAWPAQGRVIGNDVAFSAGMHPVTAQAIEALSNADRFLYIAGWAGTAPARAELNSFYSFLEPPARLLTDALARRRAEQAAGMRSDWSVVIEDHAGKILHRHVIISVPHAALGDEKSMVMEGDQDAILLNDLLPFPAKAVRISVRYKDKVVSTRKVSLGLPIVKLHEPSREGELKAGLKVTWEARDPDGDPLRFALLYGDGPTGPWTPLAIELENSSYTITDRVLASLRSSKSMYFRVIATDGVNSADAVSPVGMRVANRAPIVTIRGAESPHKYSVEHDLVFIGNAIDRDDGLVPAERMIWYLDGAEVGKGPRLALAARRAGSYDLVLKATDSHGLTGQTKLQIHVTPAPK